MNATVHSTKLKLTVLGTGNWDLLPDRHPPCFLIEYGMTRLLLDCGYGALHRLRERNVDPRHLTAIAISHFHGDHASDLLPIVDSRIMLEMRDGQRHAPFQIIGPPGLEERWRDLHRIFYSDDLLCDAVKITEPGRYDIEQYTVDDLVVQPFCVHHVEGVPSLGFKVCRTDEDGRQRIITYSGDVNRSGLMTSNHRGRELTEAMHRADIVIIEAGARSEVLPRTHLNVYEALIWAKQAHAKFLDSTGHLVINHIPWDLVEEAQDTCARWAKNNTVSAACIHVPFHDNLTLEI